MQRPRWHDAVIVAAIVALLVVGVWALWVDDLRAWLHPSPADRGPLAPVPSAAGQT
jgi:hypothetical protein